MYDTSFMQSSIDITRKKKKQAAVITVRPHIRTFTSVIVEGIKKRGVEKKT